MTSQMETLDIDEAAKLLRMHKTTLAEKAASGEIPGAKASKRWVFIKLDLLDWLRAKYVPPCPSINSHPRNFGSLISRPSGPSERAPGYASAPKTEE